MLSSELDVNIHELIELANMHPRVSILQPGVGGGGHCLPVDPWFLIDQSTTDVFLMRNARMVNNQKTIWTLNNTETTICQITESLDRTRPSLGGVSLLSNDVILLGQNCSAFRVGKKKAFTIQ